MRLSEKRAVDSEHVVMRDEDRLLRLDVDRESRRGEEVVERVVAAAKVGAAAISKVDNGVAEDFCRAALAKGRGR